MMKRPFLQDRVPFARICASSETIDVLQPAPTWGTISAPLYCDRADRIDIVAVGVTKPDTASFAGCNRDTPARPLSDDSAPIATTIQGVRNREG